MAQDKFRLEVVTPSRQLVSEEVAEMTAPGVDGEFGVLLGHTPFLTMLGVGELMYPILVIQEGGIFEGNCKMVAKSDHEIGLQGPGKAVT